MAKTDHKSVDDYIAAQPDAVRGLLEDVRGAIRKALPKAREVISYQIPAYKIDGAAETRCAASASRRTMAAIFPLVMKAVRYSRMNWNLMDAIKTHLGRS